MQECISLKRSQGFSHFMMETFNFLDVDLMLTGSFDCVKFSLFNFCRCTLCSYFIFFIIFQIYGEKNNDTSRLSNFFIN